MKRKKFKRAYIHLGTEKTGSTSIQVALNKNRRLIEEAGLYYPRDLGLNHNAALGAAFDPSAMKRPLFRYIVTKNSDDIGGFRRMVIERLERDLEKTESDSLVVSSEFFAMKADMDALKGCFQAIADEVVAIIYLREQSTFLSSLISTHLKAGGDPNQLVRPIIDGRLPAALDYWAIIRNCTKAFGFSNVSVGIFDRSLFPSADVVSDFLQRVGIGELQIDYQRENESLSFEASSFLYMHNKYFPTFNEDGSVNPIRKQLLAMVMSLERTDVPKSRRAFMMDGALAARTAELTYAGNEEIRSLFFPDRSSLFQATADHHVQKMSLVEIKHASDRFADTLRAAYPQLSNDPSYYSLLRNRQ